MEKMMLKGSKSVLYSKAVWGGVMAVLGGITAAGATVATGALQHTDDIASVMNLTASAVSAAGGLYAIYGRITATKLVKV